MWNIFHRKPTGNWQKISCTTKAARRVSPHNRMGKKGIRTGLASMGGICKGENVHTGQTLGSPLICWEKAGTEGLEKPRRYL